MRVVTKISTEAVTIFTENTDFCVREKPSVIAHTTISKSRQKYAIQFVYGFIRFLDLYRASVHEY